MIGKRAPRASRASAAASRDSAGLVAARPTGESSDLARTRSPMPARWSSMFASTVCQSSSVRRSCRQRSRRARPSSRASARAPASECRLAASPGTRLQSRSASRIAIECAHVRCRGSLGQLQQRHARRQQVAGQVAAVDGRDVRRRQRRQRARVVPVVEVAAIALQLEQRVRRSAPAVAHDAGGAQVAEVVGRERGQQLQADVGRRGAMRDERRARSSWKLSGTSQ